MNIQTKKVQNSDNKINRKYSKWIKKTIKRMWLASGIRIKVMYGLREKSFAESSCSSDRYLEPYARPVIANEVMEGV